MAQVEKREKDDDPVLLEYKPAQTNRLTPEQQVERNWSIVADRARHVPVSQIAKKHGVSKRRVQMIVQQYRDQNPTLRAHDPIEIIDELLYGYQATIADLARLAEASEKGNNLAVSVGAHNSKLKAYREMGELLQAVGVLPHDLGTLNIVVDGQIVAERIITVLERFGVGEEVFDGILAAIGPGTETQAE